MPRTIDLVGEQIQRYISKWLPLLELTAWSINLSFTRELRKHKASALDIEEYVVHELLHLVLWEAIETPVGEHKVACEERAIQRICRALLGRTEG